MAIKRKEIPPPSCPMWLATYGDLVTNMLVFFVLLVSMSEIKRDDRFIEFMQAIQEAFGYVGGMEQLPLEQLLQVKNADLAQMLVIPIRAHEMSNAPDPGVRGKEHEVTHIRRGERFADGGKYYFDELSATLTPEAEATVQEYADKLRGFRTQIEVRGHCSRAPVTGTAFADHTDLSVARSRAVAAALVQRGVEAERIIIVGAGTNEPVVTGAYTAAQRRENDRVEVFQISKYVEEYGQPPGSTDGTVLPADTAP